jgi:hypothetical protein
MSQMAVRPSGPVEPVVKPTFGQQVDELQEFVGRCFGSKLRFREEFDIESLELSTEYTPVFDPGNHFPDARLVSLLELHARFLFGGERDALVDLWRRSNGPPVSFVALVHGPGGIINDYPSSYEIAREYKIGTLLSFRQFCVAAALHKKMNLPPLCMQDEMILFPHWVATGDVYGVTRDAESYKIHSVSQDVVVRSAAARRIVSFGPRG